MGEGRLGLLLIIYESEIWRRLFHLYECKLIKNVEFLNRSMNVIVKNGDEMEYFEKHSEPESV